MAHEQYCDDVSLLDDPDPYMEDGSFTKLLSADVGTATYYAKASTGDTVYYANNTHSAIFKGESNSGSPIAMQYVISKWGDNGLFKHKVVTVPNGYDYSTVSFWKQS